MSRHPLLACLACLLAGCSPAPEQAGEPDLPAILLVTLDTTRADSLGYDGPGAPGHGVARTPHLDALAARALRFDQAYTTAPMTLPAHASMMTGLYPVDHGIHENARYLAAEHRTLADHLSEAGYTSAAFVSGLPLAGRFGLARGFDHYDDDFAGSAPERTAGETTERVLAWLRTAPPRAFVWVHYFDPHEPYDPPEPFRSSTDDPYLAEIESMDQEAGRLLAAFEERFGGGPHQLVVAGDHGEGRGDLGEVLHGNLLSRGVMRVPLLVAGTDVEPGIAGDPVSVRRIFDTVLGWAGVKDAAARGLLAGASEPVLAEALKPHFQYGWQPQVMALDGHFKVVQAGGTEVYDLRSDPAETDDLYGEVEIRGEVQRALAGYLRRLADSRAGGTADAPANLSQADKERLANLGYVDWGGEAAVREDAPRPRDMVHLFADLDAGSRLFVEERYGEAIPVFARIVEQDPENLMAILRLAVAHSVTGRERRALELFERARTLAPRSVDVRHYLGMHYLRAEAWGEAGALLASVLEEDPNRLPALEGLARVRERQGEPRHAAELLERAAAAGGESAELFVRLGDLYMAVGETAPAIASFESARAVDSAGFPRYLELGVCYLSQRRFDEARDCLDQVPPAHPGYPMALFKRAQVSVLLDEPDRADRVRTAWRRADATTRRLIETEALFHGISLE